MRRLFSGRAKNRIPFPANVLFLTAHIVAAESLLHFSLFLKKAKKTPAHFEPTFFCCMVQAGYLLPEP